MYPKDYKEGKLKEEVISKESFIDIIEYCIDDSKKLTNYKFFLIYEILICLNENILTLTLDDMVNRVVENYYNFYSKNMLFMKERKRDNLFKILKDHDFTNLEELLKKGNFLKNNMFGSLFEDTKGLIFGFSKDEDYIIINKNLVNFVDEEFLKTISDKIRFQVLDNKLIDSFEVENSEINKNDNGKKAKQSNYSETSNESILEVKEYSKLDLKDELIAIVNDLFDLKAELNNLRGELNELQREIKLVKLNLRNFKK